MIVDIYLLSKREGVERRPAPPGFEVLLEGEPDEEEEVFDRVRLPNDEVPCPDFGLDCYSCHVISPCQKYVMARWPNGEPAYYDWDFTISNEDESR